MSVEQRRRPRVALWEEVMNVQDHYSNKMMDQTTSRGKNEIPQRKRRIQQVEYCGGTLSKVQGHKGKITWRYFTVESVVLLVCLTVSLLILPLVLPPLPPPPPFLLLLLPILILALLMLLAFMPANSRHAAYAYM